MAETTTVVRAVGGRLGSPVRVGTVRATGGAVVVARLEEGVGRGDAVVLFDDGGAPVARRRS